MELKYLFEVIYQDGSIFRQTPDDKSSLDPEKRSQFYDVLQSGKEISTFHLVEKETGQYVAGVSLNTGLFFIKGMAVLLESEKLPRLPDKFTLIFYRQHTHDLDATYDTKTGSVINDKEKGHFVEYFIGWECEINGKKYTQKIAIA